MEELSTMWWLTVRQLQKNGQQLQILEISRLVHGKYKIVDFFVCCGPHVVTLRGYSCVQKSQLASLEDYMGWNRTRLCPAKTNANALLAVQ